MSIVAVAFVALGGVSASAQEKPLASSSANSVASTHAKVLPSAKCVISSVETDDQAGTVASAGKCLRVGKKVLISWSTSYTAYDSTGAICGSAPVKGERSAFHIGPQGFDRATAHIVLKAKVGKSVAVTKSVSLNPSGTTAQCGKMVNLPSSDVLCPWRTPSSTQFIPTCGMPTSGVAWNTAPVLRGNVVSAGHMVSRSGACWLSDGDDNGQMNKPVSVDWLGYHQQGKNVICSDGVVARGGIAYVEMVNPAGKRCFGATNGPNNVWSFQIPPSWGGTLYVYFQMGVNDLSGKGPAGMGATAETAIFPLPGTEDGCPLLSHHS
jgi:hypothetical protein